MKFAVLAVFTLALTHVALATDVTAAFKSCRDDQLITNLKVECDPCSLDGDTLEVHKNAATDIGLSGHLAKAFESGTYHADVTYMGIKVYSKDGDVCTTEGITCPIEAGDMSKHISQSIPSAAPSGKYEVKATVDDGSGQEVECLQVKLSIKSSATTALDLAVSSNPNVESDLKCMACEFALSYIKAQLENETTEEKIVDLVENVCKVFPSKTRPICQALIESYGPAIIQTLADKLDADKVCEFIHLC